MPVNEQRFLIEPRVILRLLKKDVSVEAIAELAGVCERTMREWLRTSRTGWTWRKWKSETAYARRAAQQSAWRKRNAAKLREQRLIQQAEGRADRAAQNQVRESRGLGSS